MQKEGRVKEKNRMLFNEITENAICNSFKNLTKICEKITRNKIKILKKPKTSIYDIPYYISDNTKISKIYNWKPKRDIKNIVLDTFNWLKLDKAKLKKYF